MNKFIITLLIIFSIAGGAAAQQDSIQYYFTRARQAQEKNDTSAFYTMITNAARLHPYQQNYLFFSAVASAMTGRNKESIDYLRRAIRIRSNFDLSNKAFDPIRETNDFKDIQKLQASAQVPVIHSDTAFVIREKTLHLECIAPGESSNTFYFGSIHKKKIIRRDSKGKVTDFTTSGQDGLTSVFGIKVKHGALWACSSPMEEMEGYDTTSKSGVFKYDVKTGKLLKKYIPDEKGIKSYIFGDLTLDPKGEVYVSDTRNNIVFKVNEQTGTLDNFFSSPEFWNLQGISFSTDGKTLFIADYIKGIFKLDLKNMKLSKLKDQDLNLSLKSVDGMTFYNNSLIAIQNGIHPMRVTRYLLDGNFETITKAVVIDNAHPAFNEPTIGCLSGKEFYYVANSLWSGYNKDHSLKPEDQLQEVVILKSKLD